MLVGHVMMIHTHTSSEEDQSVRETDHYRYFIGWSFVCGWFAFAFCLLSGGILLELYRVCRKYIDEYGNHNPSRVNKKIQRSRPVNVGSSIWRYSKYLYWTIQHDGTDGASVAKVYNSNVSKICLLWDDTDKTSCLFRKERFNLHEQWTQSKRQQRAMYTCNHLQRNHGNINGKLWSVLHSQYLFIFCASVLRFFPHYFIISSVCYLIVVFSFLLHIPYAVRSITDM